MNKLLLGVVGAIAVVSSASAADMAVPYSKAPGPTMMATAYNWSGFYIGGEVGGAWSNAAYLHTNTTGTIDPITHNASSWAGGGQLGFQYQWSNIVAGLEGNFIATDLKATALAPFSPDRSNSFRVNSLGTIVGKLGVAFDRWMVYGKGGWAIADTDFRRFITSTNTTSANSSGWDNGWTVGVGVEYAVLDNLILGLEYDFARINVANRNQTLAPAFVGTGTDTVTSAHEDVHLAMARLSYKFGWGQSVVARY
jgi:outer membrane immunogenic protein